MSCIVEGCESNKIVAKSLCSKHYHRQHRYGSTAFVKQNKTPPKFCTVDNCERKPKARSLCEAHYARFKRQGDSFDKTPIRSNSYYTATDVCMIPRCQEQPHSKKMCRSHYAQQNKHKINFEDILDLFSEGCQTCGSFDALTIDHDYKVCSESFACEKCFRGVICGPCNRVLGLVKDNSTILKNMINYIQK